MQKPNPEELARAEAYFEASLTGVQGVLRRIAEGVDPTDVADGLFFAVLTADTQEERVARVSALCIELAQHRAALERHRFAAATQGVKFGEA